MGSNSSDTSLRRQQSSVLVVNDKDSARAAIKTRLFVTGIGAVEAPETEEELISFLAGFVPSRAPRMSLVLLDYSFADWDTDLDTVHQKLRDSHLTDHAPIVILTAYPSGAKKDKLIRSNNYEIVDDLKAAPSTIEGIVKQYIG